jgi:ABC-type dipeptide/oligopeptide/nickel transport system permease subunit
VTNDADITGRPPIPMKRGRSATDSVRRSRSPLVRILRSRAGATGAALLLPVLVASVLAPMIAPHSPTRQDLDHVLAAPTRAHWLGTDDLGRDTLSRVIHGARASVIAGFVAVGVAALVGVPLGLAAGFYGGRADAAVMRTMDGLLAFPALVLAMAITAALGPGIRNVVVAVAAVSCPAFARLARGQALLLRELEMVSAARAIGVGDAAIIGRYLMPNMVSVLVIHTALSVGQAILTEAGLSFLGLGIQPPTPSWGSMIEIGRRYLEQTAWMSIGPGTAILITVLAFNFMADALRDALDPRLQRSGGRRG